MNKKQDTGLVSAPQNSKKEAPAPELADRLASFEIWLVRNWRMLFSIAAVIVALVIVYYVVVQVGMARENAAAVAVAQAKDSATLAEVVKNHASTQAVNPARMRLAQEAATAKRYDEALTYWHMVANTAADSGLVAEAMMLAASAHENGGDDNAAADQFTKVANDTTQPLARRTEAAYQAGRVLVKAGKLDAAKIMLQQAADANAGSKPMDMDFGAEFYASQAKTLLNAVNAK